jgi:hypothetical protein
MVKCVRISGSGMGDNCVIGKLFLQAEQFFGHAFAEAVVELVDCSRVLVGATDKFKTVEKSQVPGYGWRGKGWHKLLQCGVGSGAVVEEVQKDDDAGRVGLGFSPKGLLVEDCRKVFGFGECHGEDVFVVKK